MKRLILVSLAVTSAATILLVFKFRAGGTSPEPLATPREDGADLIPHVSNRAPSDEAASLLTSGEIQATEDPRKNTINIAKTKIVDIFKRRFELDGTQEELIANAASKALDSIFEIEQGIRIVDKNDKTITITIPAYLQAGARVHDDFYLTVTKALGNRATSALEREDPMSISSEVDKAMAGFGKYDQIYSLHKAVTEKKEYYLEGELSIPGRSSFVSSIKINGIRSSLKLDGGTEFPIPWLYSLISEVEI